MKDQQPRPSRVIWDWRGTVVARLREERRRRTRRLGTFQALVGLGIGALLLAFGHRIFGGVVLSIATFTLVAALVSPLGLSLRIQGLLARVGTAVGHLVTWILLVPLFLFFFVPFRLLFRRGRRDPLDRRPDPESTSYWRNRDEAEGGVAAYQRQF